MSTSKTTLQDMWDTRPPRIPKKQGGNAQVAGVCEGIGVRYQIDPTLVRIMFVLLTFVIGGGFFIYLLCWMTMPRFGMGLSPAQAIGRPKQLLDPVERSERETGWGLLVLIVLFFPTLSIGTAGALTASALGGLIVAGICWWALHQRMPIPPAGLIVPPKPRPQGPGAAQHFTSPYAEQPGHPGQSGQPGQPRQPQPGATPHEEQPVTGAFTAPDGYPHPATGRTTPPSWDPLGTAPSLWHLPDPGFDQPYAQPEEPKKKKRNRPLWFWIPVATVLTVLTFIAIAMFDQLRFYNFHTANPGGFGNLTINYEEGAELRPVHQRVGEIELNLTEIGAQQTDQRLEVGNYVGRIEITLPDDVPVNVVCAVGVGTADCPQGVVNADAKGETINIDARLLVGEIVINQSEGAKV